MKKTSTLNRNFTAAVNTLLSCIMISFLLLFTLSLQPALSQDYDFEQGSDLDKLVVMEAEHYSEYITVGDNTWDPVLEPADASNDTAMMAYTTSSWPSRNDALTSSAVLVYKINFTETGTHYVWARASRTGGGDDSYHFGLDDQIPASGTFINFEEVGEITADTWMWIKWSGASDPEERSGIGAQSYVDVPSAGVHEFQVYIRESGFKIDKIILTITPDVGYTPEGQGPAETLPVGISPLKSQQNAFSIYPNPVYNQLRIQLQEDFTAISNLDIIDTSGKLVKRIAVDNRQMIITDVSDLNPGVYFVKLTKADKTTAVKKMVKF